MTHPNDKIHLIHATEAQGDYSGLTKREYFASMALNGAISSGEPTPKQDLAEWSVQMADALIEQLNKQP